VSCWCVWRARPAQRKGDPKAACERLGLDSGGREKQLIIDRIMTSGDGRAALPPLPALIPQLLLVRLSPSGNQISYSLFLYSLFLTRTPSFDGGGEDISLP
jgi:hypothetical protein